MSDGALCREGCTLATVQTRKLADTEEINFLYLTCVRSRGQVLMGAQRDTLNNNEQVAYLMSCQCKIHMKTGGHSESCRGCVGCACAS